MTSPRHPHAESAPRALRVTLALAAYLVFVGLAAGESRVWVGPTNGDWFAMGNWNPAGIPGDSDTVQVSSNSVSLTNSTATLAAFSITNATLTFGGWSTVLTATQIDIRSNGVLTHALCDTNGAPGITNRVYLVATNVTIHGGGKINVNCRGFIARQGPGANTATSQSGSHGGNAGNRSGETYGSAYYPEDPGSGGWVGTGGGAVRIMAADTVRVDGIVDADSIYNQEGTGSGGSILIECRVLNGTGSLRANGGTAKTGGNGSGGGGGRIAVYYDPAAQVSEASAATSIVIMASGGFAATYGSPGTVYLPDFALLRSPDFNISGTLMFATGSAWKPNGLTLTGRQVVLPVGFSFGVTQTLSVIASGSDVGTAIGSLTLADASPAHTLAGTAFLNKGALVYTFTYTNPQVLTVSGNLTMTNAALMRLYPGPTNAAVGLPYGGRLQVTGDLIVHSNCTIHPYTVTTNGGSIELRARNVSVMLGGLIDANAKGYRVLTGPGTIAWPKGAGYGGRGGGNTSYGGNTYGSAICPTDPGSGANGIAGGGLVWIVSENGIVRVDGTIDASTTYAQEASGSGGAILIVCREFRGSGTLRAVGGDAASNKGAGGGGRIAVLQMDVAAYERIRSGSTRGLVSNAVAPATFMGTATVAPGAGITNYPAMPGTVFWGTMSPRGAVFIVQ